MWLVATAVALSSRQLLLRVALDFMWTGSGLFPRSSGLQGTGALAHGRTVLVAGDIAPCT